MIVSRRILSLAALAVVVNLSADVKADSVGINFRRANGQTIMTVGETAGFIPQAIWNNSIPDAADPQTGTTADIMIDDGAGTTISGTIFDDLGNPTPIGISWSADTTWSASNAGPGNLNLMSGYIDDTTTAAQPTIVTVTGVPYAHYDVYAYVGSDGNDRSGRTRLFNFFANDRWFRTNSQPFMGFVEGTALTEPAAGTGLATYTHYRSLDTSSFDLQVFRGSNNVGLHGIQIVETDGSAPKNWVAAPTAPPAPPAVLSPGVNSIGLNFVGGRADGGQPDGHNNDDGIVTGTAGEASVAQGNWNNLFGFNGTAAAGSLMDKNGSILAGTSLTWAANNLWTIAATAPAGPDSALMKGYLDTNNTSTTTVNVTGLPAEWLEYDVYVYFDGDGTNGRAGNYTITSATDGTKSATITDTANWNVGGVPGGTYTRANENAYELTTVPGSTAGNYLVFPGRSDLSFTLTTVGSLTGGAPPRAPINGIQLVATQVIPEPSTWALVVLGCLGAAIVRRRRATK
jgi:hypothetical protein